MSKAIHSLRCRILFPFYPDSEGFRRFWLNLSQLTNPYFSVSEASVPKMGHGLLKLCVTRAIWLDIYAAKCISATLESSIPGRRRCYFQQFNCRARLSTKCKPSPGEWLICALIYRRVGAHVRPKYKRAFWRAARPRPNYLITRYFAGVLFSWAGATFWFDATTRLQTNLISFVHREPLCD